MDGDPAASSLERETSEAAARLLASGRLGTCVQICTIDRTGRPSDIAMGVTSDGSNVDTATLHPTFCLAKPLLAMAVLAECERSGVGLDRKIAELVGDDWALGDDLRVAHLLNHSAGLRNPTAVDWRLAPDRARPLLIRHSRRERQPAYSEVVAGLVLEAVLEVLTGSPARQRVEALTALLGLSGIVITSPTEALNAYSAGRLRTLVNTTSTSGKAAPLLSELLPAQLEEIRPAFGSFASARGIASFYRSVGNTLKGRAPSGPAPSPEFLNGALGAHMHSQFFDEVVQNHMSFAGGFMLNLERTCGVSGILADAVGHTAGVVNAVGFYDPDTDIAACYIFNGAVTDIPAIKRSRIELLPLLVGQAPRT